MLIGTPQYRTQQPNDGSRQMSPQIQALIQARQARMAQQQQGGNTMPSALQQDLNGQSQYALGLQQQNMQQQNDQQQWLAQQQQNAQQPNTGGVMSQLSPSQQAILNFIHQNPAAMQQQQNTALQGAMGQMGQPGQSPQGMAQQMQGAMQGLTQPGAAPQGQPTQVPTDYQQQMGAAQASQMPQQPMMVPAPQQQPQQPQGLAQSGGLSQGAASLAQRYMMR